MASDLIGLFGLGKTKFLELNIKANKYKIKILHNQLAQENNRVIKKKSDYSDFFIQGILEGIIEIFSGKDIILKENLCLGRGDAFCLFSN